MPSHTLTREQSAQRRAAILDMRRQHQPWDEIGRHFDISAQRAHRIYREALQEYPVAKLEEHRHEEGELIDWSIRKLAAIVNTDGEDPATGKPVSARTKVEAINAMRGWSEHRARLYGIYAPTKSQIDFVAYDGFAAQLERLRAELGEQQSAALEAVDAEEVTEAEESAAEVEALQIEGPGKDA